MFQYKQWKKMKIRRNEASGAYFIINSTINLINKSRKEDLIFDMFHET